MDLYLSHISKTIQLRQSLTSENRLSFITKVYHNLYTEFTNELEISTALHYTENLYTKLLNIHFDNN